VKLQKIVYTHECAGIIRHLPPSIKTPLRLIIEQLGENPYLGKPLKDEFEGLYSLRYQRYRVIYRVNEQSKLIEILFAGPRTDVYLEFSRLLRKSQASAKQKKS
jgi:mRNA interferase RelE/StbE